MKKYILFFCVSLLGVALWSCKDDDDPIKEDPTIVLTTPQAGASINLASAGNVSFGWVDVEEISGYSLILSLSEDLASPKKVVVNANPFVISASDFDVMVAGFNVSGGETVTLYWSIKPSQSAQIAITETRSDRKSTRLNSSH